MSFDLAISLLATAAAVIAAGGAALWRISRLERDVEGVDKRVDEEVKRITENEKQMERAREALHALRSELQAAELRQATALGKVEELIREMRAELKEEIRAIGRK